MLANVWFAMNNAIPRLSAQDWMDQFTILTVANPYVEKEARESILDVWRNLIQGSPQKAEEVSRPVRLDADYDYDGTPIKRLKRDLPLRVIHQVIHQAFGREVTVDN